MSGAFVWIGLFTLDTLIICEMGGEWLQLYLHGLYLQGWEYLHMWAREAYTEEAACHLRRLESLCGPSSVWGLLGVVGDMRHVDSVKSRVVA